METMKRKLCGVRMDTTYDSKGGRRKDLHSDERNNENGLLQTTRQSQVREVRRMGTIAEAEAILSVSNGLGIRRAVAQRGLDVSHALLRPVAGHDGDGDHPADEADVQDQGNAGEERDAADTDGEDASTEGVEGRGAGDPFDGLHPARDGQVMVGEDGQEVGIDTEDDGRGTELHDADGLVEEAEDDAADAHDGGVGGPADEGQELDGRRGSGRRTATFVQGR